MSFLRALCKEKEKKKNEHHQKKTPQLVQLTIISSHFLSICTLSVQSRFLTGQFQLVQITRNNVYLSMQCSTL